VKSARKRRHRQSAGTPRSPAASPVAATPDPARLSPAIAFAFAKGLLADAVLRRQIREFWRFRWGRWRGKKAFPLATRAGAQVTTPCDGLGCLRRTVSKLGTTLDPECGWRYHVLIAGDGAHFGKYRQLLLTGEPVRDHGDKSQVASILAAQREPTRALHSSSVRTASH